MDRAICLSVYAYVNPFPNKLWFLRVCITSLWKTQRHLIPKRLIFHSSKFKASADDSSKFDENGSKLSKQVENTVRKGEIARYEQFLLFPQCFQKACTADR